MNSRFPSLLLLGGFLVSGTLACAQTPLSEKDNMAERYAPIISPIALKTKLAVLTADSLEGRETGTEGARKAAQYIASIFKRDGLSPLVNQGDGTKSYFLPIPLKQWVTDKGTLTIQNLEFTSPSDFIPVSRGARAKMDISMENFLIGVHQASDSAHAQDFGTLDLKDKVLILFDKTPQIQELSFSRNAELYNYLLKLNAGLKSLIARKPKAIFLVSSQVANLNQNSFYNLYAGTPTMGFDPSESRPGALPIFLFSQDAATRMLQSLNMNDVLTDPAKSPVQANIPFHLHVPLKVDNVSASDVLGFMEGTDLKNEVLVISAHYDHLGKHNGQIYHGADDDGSGSASMMTLADAFAQAKKKGHGPRRSILFLANVGEEKGLLGSDFYSKHPLLPLSQTITDLNVDMIGRIDQAHVADSNYVYVIGSGKLSSDLQSISEQVNDRYSHLKLDYTYDSPTDPNRFYYRSDHYNFARYGVPIIFYFNGVHEDYHQPTDVIEKINFGIYSKRAQLVFFTAWDLANRNIKPKVDRKSDFEN